MATYLGIDIGSSSVRGALVRTQLRRTQVVRYLDVPFVSAAPAFDGDSPLSTAPDAPPAQHFDAVSRAIEALVREAGGAANVDVIATLPGDVISLRRVELPKAAEKKLDELLPFEMESLLPFDAAETLLDHQPIDTTPTEVRVLVCAAPRLRIRAELERLAAASADPAELVPAPVALAGLVPFVPALATDGAHVLVRMGTDTTDVCVAVRGRVELARTLSAGTLALSRDPYASSPSGEGADRFARELKQTLLAWRMQGGAEPEGVWLGGELERAPGLADWLGGVLGRAPLPLPLPDAPGADPTARAAFALALGEIGHALARTKHLDLRKGEFVKRRSMTLVRELAPLAGAAFGAIALAFFFSLWARWSVLDARRALLEDELARVTAARLGEETRSPARARSLLETGRRSADPLPAFTALDALVAVSRAVPDTVTHDVSRLAVDLGDGRSGGRIELQGTVGTIEERDRIAQALGEVPCFRELELGPTTTTPDGRRNYRIEADLRCEDAPAEGERRGRRGRRGGDGAGSGESTGGEG